MPADRLLTIAEMCNYLGTSSLTLRRLRAEGIIRAYRMRRAIRFRLEEVLDALALADEQYGLRRREALIPSGGPMNKKNAMFNGKLKGLCNMNTVDLDEEPQKDEKSEAPSQRREGFAVSNGKHRGRRIQGSASARQETLQPDNTRKRHHRNAKQESASGRAVKGVQRNHEGSATTAIPEKRKRRSGVEAFEDEKYFGE